MGRLARPTAPSSGAAPRRPRDGRPRRHFAIRRRLVVDRRPATLARLSGRRRRCCFDRLVFIVVVGRDGRRTGVRAGTRRHTPVRAGLRRRHTGRVHAAPPPIEVRGDPEGPSLGGFLALRRRRPIRRRRTASPCTCGAPRARFQGEVDLRSYRGGHFSFELDLACLAVLRGEIMMSQDVRFRGFWKREREPVLFDTGSHVELQNSTYPNRLFSSFGVRGRSWESTVLGSIVGVFALVEVFNRLTARPDGSQRPDWIPRTSRR